MAAPGRRSHIALERDVPEVLVFHGPHAGHQETKKFSLEAALPGLLLSLLAGSATALGALALPCMPPGGPPPWAMSFALSLAAGVMLAVSAEMLVPHDGVLTWWTVALFSASFLFFAAICKMGDMFERYRNNQQKGGPEIPICSCTAQEAGVERKEDTGEDASEGLEAKRSSRLALLLLISLTLHNFPEGFAVAISSFENQRFGLEVGIAVALHNIPEGLSLAVATFDATKSRLKATIVPAVAGFAEPLGALLSLFLLRSVITEQLVNNLLVTVAGVMAYLSVCELLPATLATKCYGSAVLGCTMGMGVMFLTHTILDHT